MYLTRFEVNKARRGARLLLGSPQAMHAAVLSGYPSSGTRGRGRVLWRVDRSGEHVFLYVVGPSEPDLSHLVEQAGWPTTHGWASRDYSALLDALAAGQRWQFRLTANPTRAARVGDSHRSQRLGHVTANQQLAWFLQRADAIGVNVFAQSDSPTVVVRDRRTFSFRRDRSQVTLTVATFDGLLKVVNPDSLRQALVSGIGPAKAYGCGLMTLARPS